MMAGLVYHEIDERQEINESSSGRAKVSNLNTILTHHLLSHWIL